MSRTRIKICGITSPEDAAAAVLAGADAVGVVFAPSPRQVDLARAGRIYEAVPTDVTRVGVFVDPQIGFVNEAAAACGLGEVQFHGDESPELCAQAPVPVVKAFAVSDVFDGSVMEAYHGVVAAGLLDAFVEGERGGTGQTFAWEAAGALPEWLPIIVAGGLTPANVGHAIEHFVPYGVDVSSGVEEWPGNKDRNRMAAFVEAAQSADARLRAKGLCR